MASTVRCFCSIETDWGSRMYWLANLRMAGGMVAEKRAVCRVLGVFDRIVSMSSIELSLEWHRRIQDDLDRWGLTVDWPDADLVARHRSDQRGRRVRSPHFASLQQSLQEVLLIDPSATW